LELCMTGVYPFFSLFIFFLWSLVSYYIFFLYKAYCDASVLHMYMIGFSDASVLHMYMIGFSDASILHMYMIGFSDASVLHMYMIGFSDASVLHMYMIGFSFIEWCFKPPSLDSSSCRVSRKVHIIRKCKPGPKWHVTIHSFGAIKRCAIHNFHCRFCVCVASITIVSSSSTMTYSQLWCYFKDIC
jgi:hypothetical protein